MRSVHACRTRLGAEPWRAPPQFIKPDIASDEGGLWAISEREEMRLRRSPFAFRDPQFLRYVQDIACRLAGDHCPGIRVHLVHTRAEVYRLRASGTDLDSALADYQAAMAQGGRAAASASWRRLHLQNASTDQ